MLRITILALLCSMGCGGEQWSSIGTYQIVQIWQDGTCSLVNPLLLNFAIRRVDDDLPAFEITFGESNTDIESKILQSSDCTLIIELTEPPGARLPFLGTAATVYNVIETDGNLEGAGTMVVGMPEDCSQSFTINGSKQ